MSVTKVLDIINKNMVVYNIWGVCPISVHTTTRYTSTYILLSRYLENNGYYGLFTVVAETIETIVLKNPATLLGFFADFWIDLFPFDFGAW
jgi:hypothetical protein